MSRREYFDFKRVQVVTWNVNRKDPPKDLSRFLAIYRFPTILAVGLQEVTLNPWHFLSEILEDNKWTKALDIFMYRGGYTKVGEVSLVGMLLSVYVIKKQDRHVELLECNSKRTGCFGFYGNKGAVWMKLRFKNKVISFVNSHFHCEENGIVNRYKDYHYIENKRTRHPVNDNYTFWFGSLNFKLTIESGPCPFRPEFEDIRKFLRGDTLSTLLKTGYIFQDYQEQPITFSPTSKYAVGHEALGMRKRPSWSDRVLYRTSGRTFLRHVNYDTVSDLHISDHKPVQAIFQITV